MLLVAVCMAAVPVPAAMAVPSVGTATLATVAVATVAGAMASAQACQMQVTLLQHQHQHRQLMQQATAMQQLLHQAAAALMLFLLAPVLTAVPTGMAALGVLQGTLLCCLVAVVMAGACQVGLQRVALTELLRMAPWELLLTALQGHLRLLARGPLQAPQGLVAGRWVQ